MLAAGGHDVLAGQGRHRHEVRSRTCELGDELGVVARISLEDLLVVADQVHLVDGDDQVLDAEQRADEAVAARLRHDAVAGVDQDDRQVAVADAPVAMLRVYCSCPGQSAMMNLRRSVLK
jgi:hypothetical protein